MLIIDSGDSAVLTAIKGGDGDGNVRCWWWKSTANALHNKHPQFFPFLVVVLLGRQVMAMKIKVTDGDDDDTRGENDWPMRLAIRKRRGVIVLQTAPSAATVEPVIIGGC